MLLIRELAATVWHRETARSVNYKGRVVRNRWPPRS